MIRGYLIQVQATYQTLSNTYQKTYEIASDIRSEVKNYSDMPVMISGSLEDNPIYAKDYTTQLDTISHLTYGFVSNYSLFWDEYSNIKNGWSRFMELYLGYPIHFVEEDTYYSILDSPSYKKNVLLSRRKDTSYRWCCRCKTFKLKTEKFSVFFIG